MKRRSFVQLISAGAMTMATRSMAMGDMMSGEYSQLTILHTNDWHSRIEPFPMDGSRNQGLGGASKRSAMIREIRKNQENVLLFDSGDIFQGTPYFNFYTGELEFKLMSEMGYDAATIGNHDFDGGIENLAEQMNHADFSLVNANYDFKETVLNDKVLPYRTFDKGGMKIGVFGIGIELDGLVPQKLYGNTKYNDPIIKANKIAAHLRNKENCDYIICLSHLGYRYRGRKVSDVVLAKNSTNIDLILGGHTHSFMKQPDKVQNQTGKAVLINQAGWAGIILGRIDVFFEKKTRYYWSQNGSKVV